MGDTDLHMRYCSLQFKTVGEQPQALKFEHFHTSTNDPCHTFTSASSD